MSGTTTTYGRRKPDQVARQKPSTPPGPTINEVGVHGVVEWRRRHYFQAFLLSRELLIAVVFFVLGVVVGGLLGRAS